MTDNFQLALSNAIGSGRLHPMMRSHLESIRQLNSEEVAMSTLAAVVEATAPPEPMFDSDGKPISSGDEPTPEISNPVSSFADVNHAAQALGVAPEFVSQIAHVEAQIAAAAAPPAPEHPDVSFLDYRRLDEAPRPWSSDDWERDSRRAQAADMPLNRETWQAYAESGLDAVAELLDARQHDELERLHHQRTELLLSGQERLLRQVSDRAALAALDAEEQAERDAFRARRAEVRRSGLPGVDLKRDW